MSVEIIKFKCISCGKEADKLDSYGHCDECLKYFHDQNHVSGLSKDEEDLYQAMNDLRPKD
jgi:predicted ATP-dependent serine protease